MAINNFKCEVCDKNAVCKIHDVLIKFSDEAKKPLGVNITIDQCFNFCESNILVEGGESA